MKFSLRTKLSVSYIALAVIMLSLIGFSANILLESQFKNYIINQQNNKNAEIVTLINQQYGTDNGWNRQVIESIGLNALEQGMIVKVRDNNNNVIWDATLHNNGLCTQMLSHMEQNMNSRYHNFNGQYVENKYPVVKDSQNVGSIEIGYYGPFYFTDNDLSFINTLNRALFAVGAILLIFALALGTYMAKRLSKPISSAINAADQISKGFFGDRIHEKSSTKEIILLTGTINNLAETLDRQDNLRKRMTADVAHELRTPLTTLQSHLEALIDGIWKPDTDRFKSCHEEVMRITRMVGDLEKLASMENETVILNKSRFNFTDLVKSLKQNFDSDFKNKQIEFDVNGKDEIITADKDKISQVIINLLSNALKYTEQGGKTNVIVTGTAESVVLSVKDTGIGISSEDIPYIFERFYRADKSRNRLTGGSGLGLAITKAIVDAHKGTINVHSEMNRGTEFIVTLPR